MMRQNTRTIPSNEGNLPGLLKNDGGTLNFNPLSFCHGTLSREYTRSTSSSLLSLLFWPLNLSLQQISRFFHPPTQRTIKILNLIIDIICQRLFQWFWPLFNRPSWWTNIKRLKLFSKQLEMSFKIN